MSAGRYTVKPFRDTFMGKRVTRYLVMDNKKRCLVTDCTNFGANLTFETSDAASAYADNLNRDLESQI